MNLSQISMHVACLVACAVPFGAAQAERDALERPSMTSVRAASSVMLAVGRADKRLVAVGERGIVLLSDDDGLSWRQVKTPVSVSLTNVHFPTARLGWAVGHSGVVLHSNDGGETWTKQLDGRLAAEIVRDTVRAGADSAQRLAEAERLVADGPDKPFFDVRFSDEKNGLIVGAYGLILATGDGGKTWRSLVDRLDNPKGKHLYSIYPAAGELLIAGEQGALFASKDGGKSFGEVKTPYAGTYFGVVANQAGQWFAFGLRGNAYCSRDGGASWQKEHTGAPNTLTAGLRLADGAIVLADEAGRLLRSAGCGQGFQAVPVSAPSPFSGLTQAADGALILSGTRGTLRQSLKSPETTQ